MGLGKNKKNNRPTPDNVACNAKHGRGVNTKRAKRLNARRADYSRMMDDTRNHESKVDMRLRSGGYHRPGSNNK